MLEFKVIDSPDQKFSCVLANRRVTIRLRYNTTADRWFLDLSIDGEPVLHGRKILLGVDLLKPFNFGIGKIFAYSEKNALPDRNSLPDNTVTLYHTTEEEINATVA